MNGSGAWAAYRRVLVAPWQQRRNESGWAWLALLALFVVLPAAAGKGLRIDALIAASLVVAVVIVAAVWWMVLLNLGQQNHPTLARLVPSHVRRLRQVFVLAGVGACVLVGAMIGSVAGHPVGIGEGAAVGVLWIAISIRWPVAWIALMCAPMLLGALGPRLQAYVPLQAWQVIVDSPAFVPAVAVLELIAFIALSHRVLMNGGDAHAEVYERTQRWATSLKDQMRGNAQAKSAQWPRWMQRSLQRLYLRWFVRLVSQRSSNVAGRALLALGPTAHWTGQLSSALVALVIFGVLFSVPWLLAPEGHAAQVSSASWGPTIGLMIFALTPALQSAATFHARRRELALLSLVPGLPRGGRFNQALARHQLVHALSAWGLAVALQLGLLLTLHGAWTDAVAFSFGCLPFVTWGWRDWSRASAPGASSGWATLALAGSGGAMLALHRWNGVSLLWVALLSASLAVAAGFARWQRLSAAPAAWPIGRRAQG